MTENKRFALEEDYDWWGITDNQLPKTKLGFREDLPEPYLECDYRYNDLTTQEVVGLLNELNDENEKLKSFIDDLTTKGTGMIDLANGYSYKVSAVLTNWKSDVE